jgi:DNA-binding transcriptional LysR family regulator
MGLGLIQIPRYRAAAELASGKLVEVLPQFPPSALPVHVLYSHTRQLSPRLRVVKTRHAVLAALASGLG